MIPPALARMSGTTRTFLSARTASPSGVVGPLAPSTMTLARTPLAICPVICPSSAAGTRKSTGRGGNSPPLSAPPPVKPLLVVEAPAGVGHGDDARPLLGEEGGGDAADVPEPLHGDGRPFQGDLLVAAELLDQVEDAASGGLPAAQAAADADRLTGDHARLGVAPVHADRGHDPGHNPFIGPHVRGGGGLVGARDNAYLRGVAPGEVLQLRGGELFRVYDDAALGAAVGEGGHGGAPQKTPPLPTPHIHTSL